MQQTSMLNESGVIPGVFFGPVNRTDQNRDGRREIVCPFNGDAEDFVARQIKVALCETGNMLKLGGHYHLNYRELFTVAVGKAVFLLLEANDRIGLKLVELVELVPNQWGDSGEGGKRVLASPAGRLLIPPLVPHLAFCAPGTILIGATEQPFNPEGDVPFDNFPLALLEEAERRLAA